MGKARGFTMIEVSIVLVVGAIATTIGVVSAVGVIKEARYRADRARLYMDMKEARDKATNRLGAVVVTEVSASRIQYLAVRDCISRSPFMAVPTENIEYPAIDFFGDRSICYEGGAAFVSGAGGGVNAAPPPLGPGQNPFIDFIPMGETPPVPDVVSMDDDGRLDDSWKEFPDEGAFEASPCDIDLDANCGEEL